MTLLATERIKLCSTRTPWFTAALAIVMPVGIAGLLATQASDFLSLTLSSTQFGYRFGQVTVMVLAVLTVTTEYRFGTMRCTFQAAPNRTAVLLAKTTVVALLAGMVGAAAGFGSLAVVRLLRPGVDLSLHTSTDWRVVGGVAPVYLVSAVLALSVGILVREPAGAITLVLLYALLAEDATVLVPTVGQQLHQWMPFVASDWFLTAGSGPTREESPPYGPWFALAYFAAFAGAFLITALVVTERRDA